MLWPFLLWWVALQFLFPKPKQHVRLSRAVTMPSACVRSRTKPAWVRDELIRLRALSPRLGCRTLAEVFNRRFAGRESVGKTFVAGGLGQSKADIARLRRELKHRIPRPMPTHRMWALDLTGVTTQDGRLRMILGLLDHGARACLCLQALTDKRSVTILRELIAAFRRFGLPRCIRVDNEACFNSGLIQTALVLVGAQDAQGTDAPAGGRHAPLPHTSITSSGVGTTTNVRPILESNWRHS